MTSGELSCAGRCGGAAARRPIRLSHFSAFGTALVDTVRKVHQLDADDPILASWKCVLAPGIEFMASEFERLRDGDAEPSMTAEA